MKDWIEENKYLAVVIGITGVLVVLFGGLGIYLMTGNSADKKEIALKSSKIIAIKKAFGNLDEALVENTTAQINDGLAASIDLHKAMVPKKNELDFSISNTDFKARLSKYVKASKSKLKRAKVKFDQSSMFGFDKYRETLIKSNPKAIALCSYQMEAFTWLLSEISKYEGAELTHFNRKSLEEESEDQTEEPKKYLALREMPFEIGITCTEKQLSNLLASITNEKDYTFSIKMMRTQNTLVTPRTFPTLMVNNDAVGTKKNVADEFDFEDEFSSKESPSTSNRRSAREITKAEEPGDKAITQVLGSELVKAALVIELVRVTNLDNLNIKPVK